MNHKTLHQHAKALQSKAYSSKELTLFYLEKIKQHSTLNAYISIDEEGALAAAEKADQRIQKGEGTLLTGIPMAHKDNFCTKRLPTTCGSKMLQNFQAPYNATIVEKLNQAGVVMLGKTNMDEFAMGSSNETSFFGAVLNPWDEKRVPGGSSGGSAAAVAADLAVFTTGSDTGGSIRQPAAFCGLSGLKPTYGRVSRYGLVAYASSLDQAGPIAHNAWDLAAILSVMAGVDTNDSTTIASPVEDYSTLLNAPLHQIRVGLPSYCLSPELPPYIQTALSEAMKTLEHLGAEIVPLELKTEHLWVPCYYVIACAEASSNLSRFDGIRLGHRTNHAHTIHELIAKSRSEGFGLEVQRRILLGTHLLSSGFFDAYYLQALKIRRKIQNEWHEALNKVDVIMSPTTPTSAFLKSSELTHPTLRYLADIYTVSANLTGLPALSIPIGFDNHLPIGMQLIGRPLKEAQLLHLAHQFQQATQWHLTRPNCEKHHAL